MIQGTYGKNSTNLLLGRAGGDQCRLLPSGAAGADDSSAGVDESLTKLRLSGSEAAIWEEVRPQDVVSKLRSAAPLWNLMMLEAI